MGLKAKMEKIVLNIWRIDLIEDTIIVISDKSLKEYKEICKYIENTLNSIKKLITKKSDKFNYILLIRLWEFYYDNYIDNIADIDYGYCITVHKSQGSTYENIFIDILDIIKNNNIDIKSCVYTAVTRASNSLCILR